jgi:uncharacterized protein (DUF2267 family)
MDESRDTRSLDGDAEMSTTGLDVFDSTIHKTNEWIKDVARELEDDDRRAAYLSLRATLHALRDRLTVEEVAQLGAQMPMLMRGFYYEGWNPSGKPLKVRHRDEFLARVGAELPPLGPDAERAVRAVFTVLALRISAGEVMDVVHALPADLQALWT